MKRSLIAAGAALALLPASAAAVPTNRVLEMDAGTTATYQGDMALGANFNYFDILQGQGGAYAEPGTCSADPRTYCDTTLLKFNNPVPADDADGRLSKRLTVTISNYGPVPDPATDFDLLAFLSDADASSRGADLGRDADFDDTANETITFNLTTTRENPTAYALVDVVYFISAGSGFTGTIKG